MTEITWSDFEAVDMRAGTIIKAETFSEARRPAYKLWVDLGELGIKKTSAQITNYPLDQLVGVSVVCVVNFPPKQVANFMSEILVLGFVLPDETILATPLAKVPNGTRLS